MGFNNSKSLIVSTTKTIGLNGSDFETVASAITWADSKVSYKKRITLYIKNGTYNEGNLILKKDYIDIIGESKDGTIIRVDGTTTPQITLRDRSGLFAAVNTNISNLTIDVNDVKYCVHNDAGDPNKDGYEAIFTNCKFIHRGCENNEYYFPVGIGARANQNNRFIDCEFEYRNPYASPVYGIFWHNWNNQSDGAELQVIRGKFVNCGIANLSDLGSTQVDKCTFDDCTTTILDKMVVISATPGYYKSSYFAQPVSDATLVPYNIKIIKKGYALKIYVDPISRPLVNKYN